MSNKCKAKIRTREERHYFFLNPYSDMAFTRCPKCSAGTKLRKFCLVIHIDPRNLFTLNKTCRYCPNCDLIIVKKAELENYIHALCKYAAPDSIGNDYLVFGTMDRKEWRRGQREEMSPQEGLSCTYPFKDVWKFEVRPAGWYQEGK